MRQSSGMGQPQLFLARGIECATDNSLPREEGKYLYLVFRGSVKQSVGLQQFLQQIFQGKNDSYLLSPAAGYAGMTSP